MFWFTVVFYVGLVFLPLSSWNVARSSRMRVDIYSGLIVIFIILPTFAALTPAIVFASERYAFWRRFYSISAVLALPTIALSNHFERQFIESVYLFALQFWNLTWLLGIRFLWNTYVAKTQPLRLSHLLVATTWIAVLLALGRIINPSPTQVIHTFLLLALASSVAAAPGFLFFKFGANPNTGYLLLAWLLVPCLFFCLTPFVYLPLFLFACFAFLLMFAQSARHLGWGGKDHLYQSKSASLHDGKDGK